MVLMSPLVTFITQIVLVVLRRRTGLLKDGIAFLVEQIDGDPLGGFDRMEIRAGANQTVTIEDLGDFTTGAAGVWRGNFPAAKADPSKTLEVTVRNANAAAAPVPGQEVALRLMPKASGKNQQVTGTVAGGKGQTKIVYRF